MSVQVTRRNLHIFRGAICVGCAAEPVALSMKLPAVESFDELREEMLTHGLGLELVPPGITPPSAADLELSVRARGTSSRYAAPLKRMSQLDGSVVLRCTLVRRKRRVSSCSRSRGAA